MKFHVDQLKVHDTIVWQHTEMDALRKTQCLCLNCRRLVLDDNCTIANEGYELARRGCIAFAVTRCPDWHPLPEPDSDHLEVEEG